MIKKPVNIITQIKVNMPIIKTLLNIDAFLLKPLYCGETVYFTWLDLDRKLPCINLVYRYLVWLHGLTHSWID